jgi:branched-chain amino acid transport system substrate-binding protein
MAKQPVEPGGAQRQTIADSSTEDRLARVLGRPVARRDFLKLAAAGGASAGLAAFLAACGTGNGSAAPSSGGAATPSAAAGASPSISAVASPGRTIKIGYVSPKTGPLAGFGEADDFILGDLKATFASKIVIGGVTHPIEVVAKDTQSSPDTAAQVAGSLILDDKIDLMLVASTPETVNPVASQCEANGVPCISSVAPWQPYFFGRQTPGTAPADAKPFDWTYHFFWGLEDVISVFLDMWGQVTTNKTVGGLFPNDGDGNAWGDPAVGFPAPLTAAGYKLVDPGRYENLSQDFTAQINAYKKAKAEILTGVPLPPDFTNFYKQAIQQGFKPKAASIGKALLFPSSVEALADLGEGLSSEVWWSPSHPFKSSLTGATAQQLADGYTTATSKQWTQPIGFAHAMFEVAADALNRTTNVDDKAGLRDAIKATALDTIVGKVDWTASTPVPNVAKTPLVGGQWRKGTKFMYDLVIVSNKDHPEIPSSGTTLQPIA